MYSNFKEQAIEYVKEAVHEDNAGNYAKAFPLYMNALEYFRTHLKYEQNPKIRIAIQQKFTEYLNRAEEIRAVLDGHDHGGHRGFGSSSSGGGEEELLLLLWPWPYRWRLIISPRILRRISIYL
ncbi:hypothetical protein CsatB_021662 [Cannabis sativa]|uniref:MIT domain-containing protein n=1 Tax=Cannabis sativa TaxID=3483 RepID=A0A7J6G0Z1_CANSA|nr:hypothetical protein F8388_025532 [Cannabis sativa]